jgi:2-hydroxychromene-2-carboxylate isomerase
MTKSIDVFFDFISPFACLDQVKLPALAERHGCSIAYKPMDLPREEDCRQLLFFL